MPGKCCISCCGFTLIEMAMVMVVMGFIMLTVFPALSMMKTANQRALTQSNLNMLMQATAAYVQANGCLPCPTPAATTGTGFGHVRGDTNTAPCGACPAGAVEGIPPFLSLGIPAASAHDGYNHWISMRVDPLLTNNPVLATIPVSPAIAPPSAPCTCTLQTTSQGQSCVSSSPAVCNCTLVTSPSVSCTSTNAGQSVQGLCQKNLSTTAGARPVHVITPGGSSQPAAVLFISYGAQGYGSFMASAQQEFVDGTRMSFPANSFACVNGCAGGFAQCNASGTGTFCDAAYTVDNTGLFSYDDVIAFADRNTLVSRFGNGSCQTVW
jgi:prepilin-type N-terminal cleavage/methylation domain-containing protein